MKIKFTDEHQYLYVGSIITKKGELVIGFDNNKKRCVFYYKTKNEIMLDDNEKYEQEIYEIPEEKEYLRYDNIFNYVDNDILYQSLSLDSLNIKNNVDKDKEEAYESILSEALKVAYSKILSTFPDCDTDNYKKRQDTLKYFINYDKSDKKAESYFSRWENSIYIGERNFTTPMTLLNSIVHETFHVLGTETEKDDKGRIKRKLSKNTGFEGRQGFGKGINEGFINLYSNIVCDIEDDNKFETLIAKLVTMILGDNMVYANIKSDYKDLMKLSKSKSDVITFIKLVDNYHNVYERYINKEEGEFEVTTTFKHNFISEIESYFIKFFFEHLKVKIRTGKYKSKQEVIDVVNEFKQKLIFAENLEEELGLKDTYIDLTKFDELKENYIEKARYIMRYLELYIKEDNLNKGARKFAHELKKVCVYTSKITNIYEIYDNALRKDLGIHRSEKLLMIAEKINEAREFYIVKQNSKGIVTEILYEDKEKIKELIDSKLYEGMNLVEEVREKERRHSEGNIYSIYRDREGNFGFGVVVNNHERILRNIDLTEISIPKSEFDDSIVDFSYLDSYVIPDYSFINDVKDNGIK